MLFNTVTLRCMHWKTAISILSGVGIIFYSISSVWIPVPRAPACVLVAWYVIFILWAVYENCMKLCEIVPILSLFFWLLTAVIQSLGTNRLVFMFCKTFKMLIKNLEKDLKREDLLEYWSRCIKAYPEFIRTFHGEHKSPLVCVLYS